MPCPPVLVLHGQNSDITRKHLPTAAQRDCMALSRTSVEDLNECGRINAVLESFFRLPVWTPAMGAMLISGVLPGPGCAAIPDEASQLRNPAQPASDRQMDQARKALSKWVKEHTDEDDDGEVIQAPAQTTPVDYLIWCEESYLRVPEPMRPSWLNYVLALSAGPSRDGVPPPAPAQLVERVLELEQFAAVVRGAQGLHASADAQETVPASAQASAAPNVRRHVVTRRGKVNPIEDEIRIAQKESPDPSDATAVMSRLRKMATSGKYPKLTLTAKGEIQVPSGDGLRIYTAGALRQFISKDSKRRAG